MNLEIINFIIFVITLNLIVIVINKLFTKQKSFALYCGIVGFSSKKPCNPDKIALLMLHNSLKRGEDNTGIYTLETGVVKSTKKAEEFLTTNSIPKTHLFIGHVRKASVGSKEEKNAHPFENDNIVLVHNGTLQNHWQILREGGFSSVEYYTDTQVLCRLLDEDSKKEQPVFSTLSKYTGAASLLFTDKRDPTILYAYRNGDRPLFYGKQDGGIYISSLEESLLIIGCKDIGEFPPFYLNTIKEGKLVTSIYYKQKEVETTTASYYNPQSHVTNVKYKNDTKVEEFVNSIKLSSEIRTELLVDRWLLCVSNYNNSYGGCPLVKITVGKWYFIEDSSNDNEFDLQFKDDNDNIVWHNKFLFNTTYLDYPTGNAYAVCNIFSKEDPSLILFAKDTVIVLAPDAVISKNNTLTCIYDIDELVDIDINCIRPAKKEEVESFVKQSVKEINEKLKNTDQSSLNFEAFINEPLIPSTLFEDKPTVLALPNPKIDTEDVNFEELVNSETEILPDDELEEAEEILNYVLDMIDDDVDDLTDLINDIAWPELQTKVAEIKDLINESYNIEMVRNFIKEDKKD